MPRYVCVFWMEGKDHDGYCSGEDARDHEPLDEYVIRTLYKDNLINSPSDLEWVDDGCTSGGSGYCYGFGQSYTLRRILEVIDTTVSKGDLRRHIANIHSQIQDEEDDDEEEDGDENDEEDDDDEEVVADEDGDGEEGSEETCSRRRPCGCRYYLSQ